MNLNSLAEYGKVYAIVKWVLFYPEKQYTNDKTEELEKAVSIIQETTKCSNKELIKKVIEAYVESGSHDRYNGKYKLSTYVFNFTHIFLTGMVEMLEESE